MLPAAASAFSAHDHRVAALAAGPDGALHALFLDDADGDAAPDRLLYAAREGGTWQAPEPIDDTPGVTDGARLVVDGGGRVHALWLEARDAARPERLTHLLRRTRTAAGWSAEETVYAPGPGGDLSPLEVAAGADGGGRVHVLHPRSGSLVDLVGDGPAWSAPLPAGREGRISRPAAGADGMLALAEAGSSLNPLMVAQTSNADVSVRLFVEGSWRVPVLVHAAPTHSHAPQVAWDARGVLHVVWLESVGAELLPTRLLHATSANGVAWSTPREIALGGPGGALYSPRLAASGGRLHLTFARFRGGLADPRHFHAVFDGDRWSPAAEILPGSGARDSELETAVDQAGRLHALWKAADGTYRHSALGDG